MATPGSVLPHTPLGHEDNLEVFQIAAIDMFARMTPTRHGFADMFENNGCFTDRSSRDRYSCHHIHFRNDRRIVNCGSERSIFRLVLMYPGERLMIWLSPP
ncbi:hypothetical protein TNCV_1933341 [Trichonephila clavipes]|nr:hypothetical protein TNCV_1933341 [Trichonephila clavipes]